MEGEPHPHPKKAHTLSKEDIAIFQGNMKREKHGDFIDKIIQLTAYYDMNDEVWGHDTALGTRKEIREQVKKLLLNANRGKK